MVKHFKVVASGFPDTRLSNLLMLNVDAGRELEQEHTVDA